MLVTTEKDYVKLQNFNLDLPLYVLQVQHKIERIFRPLSAGFAKKNTKTNASTS